MSGHSKWASIKHKKAATDAARGKVFTKHAKLVEIAARAGGDSEMNASLKSAIDNAKAENVPNANIERAVKKGTGELKDGSLIEEVTYEAYGPEGVAIMILCLTDNRNRTIAGVRSALTKHGGRLGESGSVAWMFQRKGVIEIDAEGKDVEEIELAAIDAGAEDIDVDDSLIRVICSTDNYLAVKDTLVSAGITVKKATLDLIPDNTVKIMEVDKAKKILTIMEKLEDDDDVDSVASNFDIDESIMEELM